MRRRRRRTAEEKARLRAKFAGGGHEWAEDPHSSASPNAWLCRLCGLSARDVHRPSRSFMVNCAVRQVTES